MAGVPVAADPAAGKLSPAMTLAPAPVARPSDFETIVGLDESGGRYRIRKLDAHIRNARHLAISVFIWSGD